MSLSVKGIKAPSKDRKLLEARFSQKKRKLADVMSTVELTEN